MRPAGPESSANDELTAGLEEPSTSADDGEWRRERLIGQLVQAVWQIHERGLPRHYAILAARVADKSTLDALHEQVDVGERLKHDKLFQSALAVRRLAHDMQRAQDQDNPATAARLGDLLRDVQRQVVARWVDRWRDLVGLDMLEAAAQEHPDQLALLFAALTPMVSGVMPVEQYPWDLLTFGMTTGQITRAELRTVFQRDPSRMLEVVLPGFQFDQLRRPPSYPTVHPPYAGWLSGAEVEQFKRELRQAYERATPILARIAQTLSSLQGPESPEVREERGKELQAIANEFRRMIASMEDREALPIPPQAVDGVLRQVLDDVVDGVGTTGYLLEQTHGERMVVGTPQHYLDRIEAMHDLFRRFGALRRLYVRNGYPDLEVSERGEEPPPSSPVGLEESAVREQLERWAGAMDVQNALTELAPGAVWLTPSTHLQALQTRQEPSPILHTLWQPPGFVQRATQLAIVALPQDTSLWVSLYGDEVDLYYEAAVTRQIALEIPGVPSVWLIPRHLRLADQLEHPGVIIEVLEDTRAVSVVESGDGLPRLRLHTLTEFSPALAAAVALAPELFLDKPLRGVEVHAVPFTVEGRSYLALFV